MQTCTTPLAVRLPFPGCNMLGYLLKQTNKQSTCPCSVFDLINSNRWPTKQFSCLRKCFPFVTKACFQIHHQAMLLSVALCGCRWYNTYRKHKAHDMQQALAMYTRSLQQEGVRQWLEVGLHKRQQRLQGLASKQVRE